ncbi:MAG: ABC transporter permease [Terriglobia bacterium]
MPSRITNLFRNLLRKQVVEEALDEELKSSLEILTEEKMREGYSRPEAHRQALMELGGVEQVKEEVRAIRAGRFLEDFAKDVRFAIRTLAKSPGFAGVIIISVALGIAANATVFSVANGLLWGVLPVKNPGRMVMFSEGKSFSYPDYMDYRAQTMEVFEGGVAAHFPLIPANFGGTGEPERVWGQVVSGNYFSVLGVNMAVGRPILPEEDRVEGRDHVAVLSHSLWQRRFGADAGVLGRDVVLNGQRYTVVGVAPAGFYGTDRGIVSDFWVPLAVAKEIMPDLVSAGGGVARRNNQWLLLNARLKPGISRAQAAGVVNLCKKRIDDTYRKNETHHDIVTLQTAGGLIAGSVTPAFTLMAVLLVVAALVLLVACANVANLLLARATGRQKEIAIRLAIGASRRQLIRQLLTESFLLALAGAGAGFLLAAGAARAISNFRLPVPIPVVFDFNVDMRVVAFTAGLSLAAALLFGLVPALRATRPDLVGALKDGSAVFGRAGRSGMRSTLVVVQVALSMVLLTAAGLFLRSLGNASSLDIGFKPDNILVMAVDPKLNNYSRGKTVQFLSQLHDRVTPLPGVRSVSFVDTLPLSMAANSYNFNVDAAQGRPAQSADANVYNVFSGYFQTMGIPLLHGRDFNLQTNDQNVAIINETMAGHLFPHQDPIGRLMHVDKAAYAVIGVARNSKSRFRSEGPVNCAYLFLGAAPEKGVSFFGISTIVKTFADPQRLAGPVRGQIAALDPDMAVFNTETMQDHVDKSLLLPRISALLLGIFGAVGLTLGAIGLYGVMSYSVRRRTQEIGIRMALGARPGAVLKMILGQGLALTGVGLAIGLTVAAAVGRLAANLLYGISGTDLITFLTVPAVLVAAAVVAIVIPARRAAMVDPIVALRNE